jgi:hypothetical protein
MPTKKPQSSEYKEIFAFYEKLVATNPMLQHKGDTMPYNSHNRNMFSYLGKNGLMTLRLPEDEH